MWETIPLAAPYTKTYFNFNYVTYMEIVFQRQNTKHICKNND